MTIKIGINGYGRIGRNVLRALYENNYRNDIEIVAINNLSDIRINAHLTQYDTVHGKFDADVKVEDNHLVVNNDKITIFSEKSPENIPWNRVGIDVVFECTGRFNSRENAGAHLKGGAKKVLISAPAGNDVDATIVYGVNHHTLKKSDTIISNGSCTTNSLAPLVKPLHDHIGIENGLMNTVHSYTNDQVLTDASHKDFRRARSATHSLIPTTTGAAKAIGLVIPELAGKLDGLSIRVPTINVSLVDLTFIAKRDTTVDEVNQVLKDASEGELNGVLGYNELPLVSIDFNHNPHSSIFDATQTKVIGRTVKVLSWYDNEWGFSNRMLDTAKALMKA